MRFPRLARHLVIGVLIAAAALFLTYRKVDTGEIRQSLSDTSWPLLLIVPVPLGLSYLARIVRWKILLSPMGAVTARQATAPLLAGFMVNSLLPARAGEVVRALLLSRKTGIPRSSSLATVVLARLFDGLTLTGMALLVMTFLWPRIQPEVRAGLIGAGVVYLLALLLFVLLRLKRDPTSRLILWPFGLLGGQVQEKARGLLSSFAEGLAVLQNGKELVQVGLASIVVWVMIVGAVVPVFVALGLPLQWYYPILVIILASLGMLIPTPAGTGTIHAAIAFALPVLTELTANDARVLALVFHVSQFLPVIAVGIGAAVSEGVSAHDIERIEEEGGGAGLASGA